MEQILGRERVADHPNREATDELRFHSVGDEILRGDLGQQVLAVDQSGGFRTEPDPGLLEPLPHPVGQFVERTAHDKEDVAGIDRFALGFPTTATPLHFEGGLELTLEIHRITRGHLGLLHKFEQGRLNAPTADVATIRAAGCGDLIDFVDVNDTVLGERDVAVRLGDQLAHQVFDVAADVTRFAELRRVRLHERHPDQLGDVLDEVGFSDAGRADENDVLFGVFDRGGGVFPAHASGGTARGCSDRRRRC